MRQQENGKHKMVGKFGAYNFGEILGRLPDREYYLLQAGEPIRLGIMRPDE
jgi:hypothetical protein